MDPGMEFEARILVLAKLVNLEIKCRGRSRGFPSMSRAARRTRPSPDATALAAERMRAHVAEAAHLLKALGNEQRLNVLCHLLDGPLSVGELNRRLDLSQSALSQHLALLRESGLVETRREAQTIHYSLPDGPVVRVMALLQDIYCAGERPPGLAAARNARRARCRD
jgi:ArsR family transcriptional regulator, virulence genes transcriptional regulator